jgi:hypothetical protein
MDGTLPFEKLGAFYLGRRFDAAAGRATDDLLLYDAKDLTTHAVCLGMTGSGKTGLCLALLEEAAIDGIPAIAIDPKGDLGNLLLAFPELRAADFRPWIDESEAARKGLAPEELAARTAEAWRAGLAEWGQDGARIARLRDAADVAIYTPGSSAGLPLSVLRSLAAPPAALAVDADALRERVGAAVAGLLALLGIDADPVRSREQILLASILDRAWRARRDVEIATLIREIQSPPFERVGVIDLESFFPAKERFALAMSLNNLIASPGFAAWMEGEPLDVARLLWTPEGRPRLSILSIAHLSEAERMFFVTLLLSEVVAWMRAQPGTPSLRAVLYMDEVFGYFPPTANPPSKTPMLTLLKQARAYGLGVVLATQNPVDLDYKGLSNAGTWLIGRLQTGRDAARVLDGLEGASAAAGGRFDRARMEATIAGLANRVFLMNNVHEDEPVLFQTRWALSYLRGPLTRAQIQTLMAARKAEDGIAASAGAANAPAPSASPTPAAPSDPASGAPPPIAAATARPVLPPDVAEVFLASAESPGTGDATAYRPALLGTARITYDSAKHGVRHWETVSLVAPLDESTGAEPWGRAEALAGAEPALAGAPAAGATFAALPAAASQPKSYRVWSAALADHVYRSRPLALWTCVALKETSRPAESEGEFRARLGLAARERRDAAVERLRERYAPRRARLEERLRVALARSGREREQYQQAQMQTAISVGATVLGAFLGRKLGGAGTVGRAATAARGASRAARERADIARADESADAIRADLAALEAEFADDAARLQAEHDPAALAIERLEVRPKKSAVSVTRVALAWVPR